MSFGRSSPEEDFDWGGILCPGCKARLSTWADSVRGRCALCGHGFPEEFNWVHEEAVERQRRASERAHHEAQRQTVEHIRQAGTATYLSDYLREMSNDEGAGAGVGRRELIVQVRARTGAPWWACRDFVDEFLAEVPPRSTGNG